MAAQAKRVLSIAPPQQDMDFLNEALAKINALRFGNQLKIGVRWAIPSAVEPRDPAEEVQSLPKEDQAIVASAIQAYAERDFVKAKQLIEPLCAYELKAIIGLYTSIIRHLKEDIWFSTSKNLWIKDPHAIAPAAASIEVIDGEEYIHVHPALSSIGLKAPHYVINYVLHHECLHKILDTSSFNPHPTLFRRLERSFPKRASAVEWLRKHRFSTIDEHS